MTVQCMPGLVLICISRHASQCAHWAGPCALYHRCWAGQTFNVFSPCEESLHATLLGGVTSPVAATATDVHTASPIGGIKTKKPKVVESTSNINQ